MHELSIAKNLIEIAAEAVGKDGRAVAAVHIKVGALSGVAPEALTFAYDLAIEGTVLAGSKLMIQCVPVKIFCQRCCREVDLPGIQSFACPLCGQGSSDLRSGRELDIVCLEMKETLLT